MKPIEIILHHSLTRDSKTVSWGAIRQYHTVTLGWRDIGYSYGIELIKNHHEILVGRMMNESGAHCRGHNSKSLGVCFVGNFDFEPPSKSMWDLGVRFVKSLCETLNIHPIHIHGHNEFSSKSCPGKMFNVDQFKMDVSLKK